MPPCLPANPALSNSSAYPEIAYVAAGNLSPSCLASAPLHGPAPAVTLWTVPVASLPRGEHQGWDVACNPQ